MTLLTCPQDHRLQLSRTVLSHTNFKSALLSRKAKISNIHVFNTQLDFPNNEVTDQKSSGRCVSFLPARKGRLIVLTMPLIRCWLFATTNVIQGVIVIMIMLTLAPGRSFVTMLLNP